MPNYTVIVTNRADTGNTQRSIGGSYIETIDAPSTEVVEQVVQRDIAKAGADVSLYSWTITETAP